MTIGAGHRPVEPPRVAVLTGSYGGGHDAAARELAAAFRGAGCQVRILDIVDLLPLRLGPLLKAAYYAQLRRRPGSWGTTLELIEPGRRLSSPVTRVFGAAAARVSAAVAGSDLVVTTHPFGAQALGHARATGRLTVPAVTYFTDASVHPLWVNPGIDLNLAILEVAAEDARRHGVAATVISPLVPAGGPAQPGEADPLAAYEIIGPRALVTGGSLGMGELGPTCRDVLATGVMTPVVLCGTDRRLRRRLGLIPGVVALGWRDDVPTLMAHSDCVVQNSGGFSSLEAFRSGTPTLSYRPIPGHGETNSRNLERAGLAPWARSRAALADLLSQALAAPRVDRIPAAAPDAVGVVLGRLLPGRVEPAVAA